MMRKPTIVAMSAFAVTGVVALAAAVTAHSSTERSDCPGKIVCPLTGQEICRDKCPTIDPNRPDCPGRVVCPLTGELVCEDRCPLGKNGTTRETPHAEGAKVPPCCANKG